MRLADVRMLKLVADGRWLHVEKVSPTMWVAHPLLLMIGNSEKVVYQK